MTLAVAGLKLDALGSRASVLNLRLQTLDLRLLEADQALTVLDKGVNRKALVADFALTGTSDDHQTFLDAFLLGITDSDTIRAKGSVLFEKLIAGDAPLHKAGSWAMGGFLAGNQADARFLAVGTGRLGQRHFL
jgi:hypothetical protein